MIIGGQGSAETSTWEIRTATGTLVSQGTLNAIRNDHTSNLLANGNVIIVGGRDSSGTWEIRNQSGGMVASTGTTGQYHLWASRAAHASQAQSDAGNLLIVGGIASSTTWELRSSAGLFLNSGYLASGAGGGHTITEQ